MSELESAPTAAPARAGLKGQQQQQQPTIAEQPYELPGEAGR